VVMLARADHRAIFAIPWEDRTVLGTTDTDFAGDPDAVCATAEDAAYLLETANHYFPGAALGPDDVLATWAGLRPLLSPARPERESDVSREHQLLERPGLVTIAGGKLTTYRRMAIEVVDRAGAQIGKIPAATTADRPLPGARGVDGQAGVLALSEGLAAHGLEAQVARHLAITYGSRGPLVAARAATDETAGHRIEPELPFLWGEVDEAVEQELAVTLVDVLERRVPLLLRSRDQGLAVAPRVAERLSRRLGWSALRRADELQRYQAQVELSRRFRSR
jgi:glycerol-3-phosphate dehydrogenase